MLPSGTLKVRQRVLLDEGLADIVSQVACFTPAANRNLAKFSRFSRHNSMLYTLVLANGANQRSLAIDHRPSPIHAYFSTAAPVPPTGRSAPRQ
jgi:hypothetical protein